MSITLDAECSITQEGDVLCLIGSDVALGAWDAQKSIQLETSASLFPRWQACLPLSASGSECKLIVRRKGGHIDWEPGENRQLPSTSVPATMRMTYGRREIDLIPETSSNGYAAD
eukprot:g31053.t1